MATFEQLVAEAQAAPVSGWDFSWLTARCSTAGEELDRFAGVAAIIYQRRFLVVAAKPGS